MYVLVLKKKFYQNGLPEKLSVCGLKHILFGFESASYRVLTLMNKTNDLKTYTELAEKIVKTFNNLKIYVHFPIIIVFLRNPKEKETRHLNLLIICAINIRIFLTILMY